jgi:heterodisulfide reductase subunit C
MEVDMASVMDALRALAVERGAATPEGNAPLFNSAFLNTVKMFGRTYDLAIMAVYKMGTRTFMRDADKLPALLKKRKMALMPGLGADRKTVRRIFERTRQAKGGR